MKPKSGASEAAHQPSRPTQRAVIDIDPRRFLVILVTTCLAVQIVLFLLDYVVNFGRLTDIGALRRLFNTTREDGLASFFGVTQTALVALTLWFVYLVARAQRLPSAVRWSWFVIALFFTYMAVDDGSMLHERLGTAAEAMQEPGLRAFGETSGGLAASFPSYTWHIVVLPVLVAFGLYMAVFLIWVLPQHGQRLLVLAGVSCFAIAVGLDFMEGLDPEHPFNPLSLLAERTVSADYTLRRFRTGPYETLAHFSKSLEETIEMLGMTLLWAAFLSYLFGLAPSVTLRFLCRDPKSEAAK